MTRWPLVEGQPRLILWPRGRALGCEATLGLEAGSVMLSLCAQHTRKRPTRGRRSGTGSSRHHYCCWEVSARGQQQGPRTGRRRLRVWRTEARPVPSVCGGGHPRPGEASCPSEPLPCLTRAPRAPTSCPEIKPRPCPWRGEAPHRAAQSPPCCSAVRASEGTAEARGELRVVVQSWVCDDQTRLRCPHGPQLLQ